MALDKAIEHKKEHRKMYRGSKAIDASCRNHGGCDWCLENRTYKYKKKKEAARLKEDRCLIRIGCPHRQCYPIV